MSRIGRWCAIGALVLGTLTLATWNRAAEPAAADVQLDGDQLFQAKGCAACHGNPRSSAAPPMGAPSLHDAALWAGERRPGMTAEEYISESIRSPSAFISPAFDPGYNAVDGMPQLRLQSAEIAALVEYLLANDLGG